LKSIRSRNIAALICLPFCTFLPRAAHAFYVDGFWSGMSTEQFVLVASAQGVTAQPGEAGYFYLAAASPPLLLSRVGFCGNILVSYSRNIQSDADYARVLASIFSLYGPPTKMQFSGDIEPGVAAGAFRATGFTLWTKGADRVSMESYFDWRLHHGQLFRQQPASVRFETLNPCNN
jgi:hypothetical protein